MWFNRAVGAVRTAAEATGTIFVRYFSRERAVNVRKINPKVPTQEAYSIARDLYDVIKSRGPLTIGNTWTHAQEAGVTGLQSKTHMKLLLKWMRGRQMLKLICNQVGSNKKFFHCTLPEDPQTEQFIASSEEQNVQLKKSSNKPKAKKSKKKSK